MHAVVYAKRADPGIYGKQTRQRAFVCQAYLQAKDHRHRHVLCQHHCCPVSAANAWLDLGVAAGQCFCLATPGVSAGNPRQGSLRRGTAQPAVRRIVLRVLGRYVAVHPLGRGDAAVDGDHEQRRRRRQALADTRRARPNARHLCGGAAVRLALQSLGQPGSSLCLLADVDALPHGHRHGLLSTGDQTDGAQAHPECPESYRQPHRPAQSRVLERPAAPQVSQVPATAKPRHHRVDRHRSLQADQRHLRPYRGRCGAATTEPGVTS